MTRQVAWLGSVLAARGMPRLLLQRHLETLARTLTLEVPSRAAHYGKLAAAARGIAEARHAAIPEDRAASLAAAFETSLGSLPARELAGAGALLVAAVQDERAGIVGAVESLERWLVDASRFSEAWIASVRGTLAAARRA